MTKNGNGHNGRYTAAQFITAIPGTGGIITSIAKKIGCEWHTAKRYITKYPTIAQAYNDEANAVLDMAEVEMIKAMKDGELSALKFYLKTKGKHRGYVERQEHRIVNEDELDRAIEREMAKLAGSGKAAPTAAPSGPE